MNIYYHDRVRVVADCFHKGREGIAISWDKFKGTGVLFVGGGIEYFNEGQLERLESNK